jgi:hypothetical protein
VFFRELPAAVPGAFRLLANLIAAPIKEGTLKATENKENKVSRKIGK